MARGQLPRGRKPREPGVDRGWRGRRLSRQALEAGYRALAVGYPGQLNAAFDAEEMRLSLLWRGRFLNAGPHWTIQGMGLIRPLGTDVMVFPHGSPLAVLADANAPWPAEASKTLGMKFTRFHSTL